jgi:hypothetical protein
LGRCRALGGACRAADHLAEAHGPTSDDVLLHYREPTQQTLDRCRASAPCSEEGRCDANDSGDCVVGSDEDCEASAACRSRGACKKWSDNEHAVCAASCEDAPFCKEGGRCLPMADGLCGAGDEEACRASEACRLDGACELVDDTCQATESLCATWDGCRFDGRCALADGQCRLKEGACAKSIPCAKLGACSSSELFEGCGVGSDADCAGSEVCEKYGWCRAAALGYWPMTTSRWFCFGDAAHPSE